MTKWRNGSRCCCCSSAPLGNGSRLRTLRRCARRRVGCCSLAMVLTRRGSLRNFYGFGFGFLLWESDRAEGEGEGEMRKDKVLMG